MSDYELRELIRLVKEITIIEHEDYYPIPMEKINQRDVLTKRLEQRLSNFKILKTILKKGMGLREFLENE